MTRRLSSLIFLLTAISVGLGGLGHGAQWSLHVAPALAGLDPPMMRLLELVWLWVSGAMLTLGVLLVWCWWRMGRGERSLVFVPWVVSCFYFVEGVYGAVYLGRFFLIFVAQAVLLSGSGFSLRRMRSASTGADPDGTARIRP